jgi:uncharacterized protein (TIGR00725 family)
MTQIARTQIAVIGSGACEEGSELARLAEEVGEWLAKEDAVLVCGGLGGVMEAASRGAAQAGGMVIGILPEDSPARANPHCTQVISTGVGEARNLAVVASGEAVIAVGGEWGTLSEIGHARKIGRTVIALRSWTLSGRDGMEGAPGLVPADSAEEAVAAALDAAGRGPRPAGTAEAGN